MSIFKGSFGVLIQCLLFSAMGLPSVIGNAQELPPSGHFFWEGDPQRVAPGAVRKPWSEFGKSEAIKRFLTSYRYVDLRHAAAPPVRILEGSLAWSNPQLALLLMDLRFLSASVDQYRSKIPTQGRNAPGLCLRYVDSRDRATDLMLAEFLKVLNAAGNRELHQSASLAIARFHFTRRVRMEPFFDGNLPADQLMGAVRSVEVRLAGLIGELYVSVALPGAISVGETLETIPELMTPFLGAWDKIKTKIKETPGLLQAYRRRFPALFSYLPPNGTYMNEGEILERIKRRILSEQIDHVRIENGVLYLGETKITAHPLDARSLNNRFDKFTWFDQMESKKQIAKLLEQEAGLNIRYEYVSSAGFEESLARKMSEEGWILHSIAGVSPGCSDLLRRP
jgi:hypothetical protein